MGSRFAAILAKENEVVREEDPKTIADIPETSNCYFLVYDGPYVIAEGSLLTIKYKLPLKYIEQPIRSYERNPQHPRIVSVRL